MRDSVPRASYSSVCNVLHQWNISRSSLLIESTNSMIYLCLPLLYFLYIIYDVRPLNWKYNHRVGRLYK